MKKNTLIILSLFVFSSCISTHNIGLQGTYSKKEIEIPGSWNLEKARNIIKQINCEVTETNVEKGVVKFIQASPTWTHEKKKSHVPINAESDFVIKDFFDIGANIHREPGKIIAYWEIDILPNMMILKNSGVTAYYYAPYTTTDYDAGFSLGNFEKRFQQLCK